MTFSTLLNNLFGRGATTLDSDDKHLAVQLAAGLPANGLPPAKMLCVFAKGRLVNSYRDGTPPARQAGEEWWLVPADDTTFDVPLAAGEHVLMTRVSIRFEPESELLTLLSERESFTEEDVNSLVTSDIAGLLEMLGYEQAAPLTELSELDRERLRAKASLLLQSRGLRCTHLGPFEIAATVVEQPAVEEPAAAPAGQQPEATATAPAGEKTDPHTHTTAAEKKKSQVPSQLALAELAGSARSPDDWEKMLAALEGAGCNFDEHEAGELYDLGSMVLSRSVQADKAAARMEQIARNAVKRAAAAPPESRRQRGLDIRLETSCRTAAAPAATVPVPGGPNVPGRRRPWTWWMFSHRAVDERLQNWLHDTISTMKSTFDSYRSRTTTASALVPLRRIDERLQLTLDLMATMSTLTPHQSNLRLSRARVKELVRSVEGAVTAAETALAETRSLQKLTPASEPWAASCDSIAGALDHLMEQLRQRRKVR